jgi:hypothetical protein
MPDSEPDEYINMRVPRAEYEKLKQLREKMKKNPSYSWAGSLALGAFIGLVAGLVIDEYLNKDKK